MYDRLGGRAFLGYRFKGATAMVEVAPQAISKSLARVTSLLEQQVLEQERWERHAQGFVNWARQKNKT